MANATINKWEAAGKPLPLKWQVIKYPVMGGQGPGPFDMTMHLRGVNQASPAIRAVAGDLAAMGRAGKLSSIEMFSIAFVLRDITQGLRRVTRESVGFITGLVRMAADFDQQMRHVFTQIDTMGMSVGQIEGEFQRLRTAVFNLAKDVPQVTKELSEGLFDIFSSMSVGLETAIPMLRRFSMAATAGFTDIRTAGRGAITMMNAFGLVIRSTDPAVQKLAQQTKGLSAEQIAAAVTLHNLNRVLDVQFRMVELGVGEYSEFANALGNVVSSARAAGQQIETLGGLMAFTTRQGLNAARAGTAIARALDLITRPQVSQRMKAVFDVDVIDRATGGFRQMDQILVDLRAKLQGMTEPQIINALGAVFGQGEIRAMRFFKLALSNIEELQFIMGRFGDEVSGSMERAWEKAFGTLNIGIDLARNNLRLLGISIGTQLLPLATNLIGSFTDFVRALNDMDDSQKRVIAGIIGLGTAFLVMATAVTMPVMMVTRWISLLKLAGIEIAAFFGLLKLIASFAGILAVVLVALVTNTDRFSDSATKLSAAFKPLLESALTLVGALGDELLPAIAELVVAVSGPIVVALTLFARALTTLIDVVNQSEVAVKALAVVLLLLGARAAFSSIATGVALFSRSLDGLALRALYAKDALVAFRVSGLVSIAASARAAGAGLVAMLGAINPVIAAIAILGTALFMASRRASEAASSYKDFVESVSRTRGLEGVAEEIAKVEREIAALEETNRKMLSGPGMQFLFGAWVDILDPKLRTLRDQLGMLKEEYDSLSKTAAEAGDELVGSLKSAELAEKLMGLRNELGLTGEQWEELADNAVKTADEIDKAWGDASNVFKEFADQSVASIGDVNSALIDFVKGQQDVLTALIELRDSGLLSMNTITEFAGNIEEKAPLVRMLAEALRENTTEGRELIETFELLQGQMRGLGERASTEFTAGLSGATVSLGSFRDEMGNLVEITRLASGRIGTLKDGLPHFFDEGTQSLREFLSELGATPEFIDSVIANMRNLNEVDLGSATAEVNDLQGALGGVPGAAEQATTKMQTLGRPWLSNLRQNIRDTSSSTNDLEGAVDSATGAVSSLDRTSLRQVQSGIEEVGRKSDMSKPKVDNVKAAVELLDRQRVDQVVASLLRIVAATDRAVDQVNRLINRLHAIPNINRTVTITEVRKQHSGGPVGDRQHFQGGGHPISRGSSDVESLLHMGEWVIQSRAVRNLQREFGPGIMATLNQFKNVRDLAQHLSIRLPTQTVPPPQPVPTEREGRGRPMVVQIQGRFDGPEEIARAIDWDRRTRGWE